MSRMRTLLAVVLSGLAFNTPAKAADGLFADAGELVFVIERNTEIDGIVRHVEAVRAAEFAAARNREAERALIAYESARFERDRNREINASIAAVEKARVATRSAEAVSAKDLNEIAEVSAKRVAALRLAEFQAARNFEIDRSILTVAAARFPLETGAIAARE